MVPVIAGVLFSFGFLGCVLSVLALRRVPAQRSRRRARLPDSFWPIVGTGMVAVAVALALYLTGFSMADQY